MENLLFYSNILICVGCRKVYYCIWRKVCETEILNLIHYQNFPEKLASCIINCLNSEDLRSYCSQFLEFTTDKKANTRNLPRCDIYLNENRQTGHENPTDLDALNKAYHSTRRKSQIDLKYIKICRLCRFRAMFLKIREIPKLKLVIDLSLFTEDEKQQILQFDKNWPKHSSMNGKKLGKITIQLQVIAPEIQKIFTDLFGALEKLMDKSLIEIGDESANNITQVSLGQTTCEIEYKLKSPTFYPGQKIKRKVEEFSEDDTKTLEKMEHLKKIQQPGNLYRYYDFKDHMFRFSGAYDINVAMTDLFDIFHKYNHIASESLEKIRLAENFKEQGRCRQSFELLPLAPLESFKPYGVIGGLINTRKYMYMHVK